MKKRTFGELLFLLLFLFICYSCSDDKPESPTISLNPTKISFEYDGGEKKVKLTTNNNWSINGDIPNWISLNPTWGEESQEITIVAKPNIEEEREISIIFTNGDTKATLNIFQPIKERELTFSSLALFMISSIDFDFEENSNGRTYNFRTKQLFFNSSSKEDITPKVFLGNLIDKNLKTNTDISEYKGYTFNPINVSSQGTSVLSQSFIPSKVEQDAYAKKIIEKKPKQNEHFHNDGIGVKYNSHRELYLIGKGNMGVNLDEIIFSKSYKEKEMEKKNGLIYSFNQTVFSLYMDIFDSLVKEEIKEADFPENNLAIITSVSYGRLGLLIIESDHSVNKIKPIINKIEADKSTDFSEEEKTILNEIDAYHLFYDESQQLQVIKGKADAIQSYKEQIVEKTPYIFPFRFGVSDFFTRGETEMNFQLHLP